MANSNLYQYHGPGGQKLCGYRREYKGRQLRKKGFRTKADAENRLRQAMSDIDALERGEIRVKPTTLQDALDLFKRKLAVRSNDKPTHYGYHCNATINALKTFVDRFGPNLLVREVTAEDMREWFQSLSAESSQSSACTHLGRLNGMFKHAQLNRPDLATWLRPKVHYRKKPQHQSRIVEPDEYQSLVTALLNPKRINSRMSERVALWRDAAHAVRILRNTGARLNEVLRMRLDQVNFKSRTITVYASKTESERVVPMSDSITQLIRERMDDGLADHEYVFARARSAEFHISIERACRLASKDTGLAFGRNVKNGFTLHSLRHTFITELLARTGDIATTMKLSGHRSLQSFSGYLHTTEFAQRKAAQVINSVDGFLTGFEHKRNVQHAGSEESQTSNSQKNLQVKSA